jgi:hypothetical protein
MDLTYNKKDCSKPANVHLVVFCDSIREARNTRSIILELFKEYDIKKKDYRFEIKCDL